jgi:hypothetical protein
LPTHIELERHRRERRKRSFRAATFYHCPEKCGPKIKILDGQLKNPSDLDSDRSTKKNEKAK